MSMKTWGDFEIQMDKPLGSGGMGAVYKGRQVSLDRPAAVKVLKKELTENSEFVQRFHREASLLARLVDMHVVQVFGAGEAEGFHYYAMEYVEGEDISARLKRGERYTIDETLLVALHVGKALQAAWRHKIVHRDIKPSNILVTSEGLMKVMDFGLAKNPDSELTQSEVIMGTAKYMSPEQATGSSVDIRSDLYSLGVVLYQLSTGEAPFVGESATAVMYQQVHQLPKPPRELNPEIPEDMEALILRLMAKDPKERFQTPEATLLFVKDIVQGVSPDERSTLYKETVLIRPSTARSRVQTPGEATAPPKAPSSAPLIVSLIAAVLVVGTGGYFVIEALSGVEPPPPPPPVVDTSGSGTGGNGDPPPPPPPDTGPAPWQAALDRGLEAFRARDWAAAHRELSDARAMGAKDVDEKIAAARGRDLIARGDAETDEEKALAFYLEARGFVPEEEGLPAKTKRTTYRRWEKSARALEKEERWANAAADWKRAADAADATRKPAAEARQLFCETFALAVRARAEGKWRDVIVHFRKLAKDPGVYGSMIDGEIRRAETELRRMGEAAAKKKEVEFNAIVAKIRDAVRMARWAEAVEHLKAAKDPEAFAGVSKGVLAPLEKEVARGASVPNGMVYVYAGGFRMGGGDREVDGPEHSARTGAYYIDAAEVTAGEYGAYLKALKGGHHEGCRPEEPAGKSHEPRSWSYQKPANAVTGVDWWDAWSYAAWKGGRLPTEAEWEKAAGYHPEGVRRYPWGDEFSDEGGNSFFGCRGMGGGVLEWTADWFDRYPDSASTHPDYGEKMKVLRGGVLLAEDAARDARVTFRRWYLPSYRSRFVGFRCVQDPKGR